MEKPLTIPQPSVITNEGGELRSLTGPKAVEAYRYKVLISGLRLEKKCPGMRVTRGPSCLSRAKAETGLRTNNIEKHIERLEIMMQQAIGACIVVTDGEVE